MQAKPTLLLALACVSVVLYPAHLALTPLIAKQRAQHLEQQLLGFMPQGSYDNHPLQRPIALAAGGLLNNPKALDGYLAYKKQRLSAVIVPVTVSGYEGPIRVWVAVAADGKLLNSRIIAQRETPTITDHVLAANSIWRAQFKGRSAVEFAEVDQVAGATRTSRAVVEALARGVEFVNTHPTLWPLYEPRP